MNYERLYSWYAYQLVTNEIFIQHTYLHENQSGKTVKIQLRKKIIFNQFYL